MVWLHATRSASILELFYGHFQLLLVCWHRMLTLDNTLERIDHAQWLPVLFQVLFEAVQFRYAGFDVLDLLCGDANALAPATSRSAH